MYQNFTVLFIRTDIKILTGLYVFFFSLTHIEGLVNFWEELAFFFGECGSIFNKTMFNNKWNINAKYTSLTAY